MKHPAIKEHHLYGKVYAKGQCSKGRLCVVYVLRDYAYGRLLRANPRDIPFNRVGLTVTKSVGGAVKRSRVRRILRAGLSQAEQYAPVRYGKLVVICARCAAAEDSVKSTDIGRELIRHFTKLGMYPSIPPSGTSGGKFSAHGGHSLDRKGAEKAAGQPSATCGEQQQATCGGQSPKTSEREKSPS